MLRVCSATCILIGLLSLAGSVPEVIAYRDMPVQLTLGILLVSASLSLIAAGALLWPRSGRYVGRAIALLAFATAVHAIGAATRTLGVLADILCVAIPLAILAVVWRRRAPRALEGVR